MLPFAVLLFCQKQQIVRNTIINAFELSNCYSWKDETYVNGIQYFTPELQQRYFLRDYFYNVKYIKDHRITSNAKVVKILNLTISEKTARVSLILAQSQVDVNGETSWSSKIDATLIKTKNRNWIIDGIKQSNFEGSNNITTKSNGR